MGFIADAVGRQNTLVLGILGSTMSVVAFWLTSAYDDDTGMWLAFVVLYGFFAAGELYLFIEFSHCSTDRRVQATTRSSQPQRSKSSARTHMPLSMDFCTLSEAWDRCLAHRWEARSWVVMVHDPRHT
jgi:hypothetical protein